MWCRWTLAKEGKLDTKSLSWVRSQGESAVSSGQAHDSQPSSVVVEVANQPDVLLAGVRDGVVLVNHKTGHVEHLSRFWDDGHEGTAYDK